MSLAVAVLKERAEGERRVALDPSNANKLAQKGFQVLIENGAGKAAGFTDKQYSDCILLDDPELILTMADIWLWVQVPATEQLANLPDGRLGIGLVFAHRNPAIVETLNQHHLTCLALELVPSNGRTRSMDVLSSQATVEGYSAVLRAAILAPRLFPMLTMATGTLDPARVVIIGAGVAGLQAIATARRLGAQVEVYDACPTTREKVESLGATMIGVADISDGKSTNTHESPDEEENQQQVDGLAECLARADVVVSTVNPPGTSAPNLITESMVKSMKPGSVIVDLAAESGGNCSLTKPGETVFYKGVLVDGPLNLASESAMHASEMYARSLLDVLELLIRGESIEINREDEVINGTLLTHEGKLVQRDTTESPTGDSPGD